MDEFNTPITITTRPRTATSTGIMRRKRSLPANVALRTTSTTATTIYSASLLSIVMSLLSLSLFVLVMTTMTPITTTSHIGMMVLAYAPNHPLHPLHPILTNTATNTNTKPSSSPSSSSSSVSPPEPTPKHHPFMSLQPPKLMMKQSMNVVTATKSSSSSSSSSSTLATPTVDQLELHQLLQRQRHHSPITTQQHMKTTETDVEEEEGDDDDDNDDSHLQYAPTIATTKTTTASSSTTTTTTNLNKKKKIQRKRSGVITSSRDGVVGTVTSRQGKSPNTSSSTTGSSNKKNYVPLLTAAEEMEYSYRIRTLRAALRIREQLVILQNGIYIHPTEEQWCMACGCTTLKQLRRLIHEGQAAKTQLISSNTGLVVQYAKKQYATLKQAMEAGGGVGTILTLSDIIQEGHFGLIEAAERYQPEKGFRFSTYATYWVKQRILRCISDSSRTIRLPVHVHETLYKIKKAKRTLYSTMGREPTITEIAQLLDMSEDRIRSCTASSRNVISLERPLSGTVGSTSGGKSSSTASSATSGSNGVVSPSGSIGGGSGRTGVGGTGSSGGKSSGSGGSSMTDDTRTLLDTIASDGPTPEEDAVLDSMRRDIRAVLDTELAELEQQVVRYRFGLVYDDYDEDKNDENGNDTIRHHRNRLFNNTIKCGESYSVRETSQILQISMDRVRLLEARALNKLRHPMRNYKLKDYVQGLGSTTTTTSSSSSSGSRVKKPLSSLDNATSKSSSSRRLRPKSTTMPAIQPLSPLQQWLSFQQSEYNSIDENDAHSSSDHTMTKSRLEEAYANSPSSYSTTDDVGKSTSSADRFWFF